ncbi:MAG: hypothetical protein ABFS16_03310 [Bacteroidota bacterium]
MNFITNKIKEILVISSVLFLVSCQKDEFDIDMNFKNKGNFFYQTQSAFCQRESEKEIWSKSFYYDKNNNLTETITFRYNKPDKKKKSVFTGYSKRLSDSTFYYRNKQWELSYSYQYKYSRNKLTERLKHDEDGTITHKSIYKYSSSKLQWEEFYYFTNEKWQFQYAHKYEYYNRDQVIKKKSYTTEAKDEVYDTYIYINKNGKLREEKRIIRTGKTSYEKKFYYTSKGFIDYIIKDDNIIEQNFYENDKLIEKHTFNFGIDPGFSPCYGNLIYKYEY